MENKTPKTFKNDQEIDDDMMDFIHSLLKKDGTDRIGQFTFAMLSSLSREEINDLIELKNNQENKN